MPARRKAVRAATHLPQATPGPTALIGHRAPMNQRVDLASITLAVVLALGFSSTFLVHPLRLHHTSDHGVILGESLTRPLQVSVDVIAPGIDSQQTIQPVSATLTETLARAAGVAHTSLSYDSRGDGMYLHEFFGLANGPGGHWHIAVNDQPVIDLGTVQLQQGDLVTAVWQVSIP